MHGLRHIRKSCVSLLLLLLLLSLLLFYFLLLLLVVSVYHISSWFPGSAFRENIHDEKNNIVLPAFITVKFSFTYANNLMRQNLSHAFSLDVPFVPRPFFHMSCTQNRALFTFFIPPATVAVAAAAAIWQQWHQLLLMLTEKSEKNRCTYMAKRTFCRIRSFFLFTFLYFCLCFGTQTL